FAKIKQYRRIATRYDKTSTMFMSALSLVGILIWLKL
ncbi:MAG: Transposase domain, partial [Francisellaceae bacterium]|nr:Transposase domain [Francisellaceae bacterium]